jgi:hypothetical protein
MWFAGAPSIAESARLFHFEPRIFARMARLSGDAAKGQADMKFRTS